MGIKLLITDLDNTLYDWIRFYVPSFLAMVAELSSITGIPEEDLKASFKLVHERRRSTEYAFAIEELDLLAPIDASLSAEQKLQKYLPAILAFRKKRSELLCLYPGVESTLLALKQRGIQIAALTDTTTYYASQRLRQLGIENYFDLLCATEDHGIPNGVGPSVVRKYPDEKRYRTSIPAVIHSGEHHKPDPLLVRSILDCLNITPDHTLLIGDSLYKDISMAQRAGVTDVFAAYGTKMDTAQYEELLKITYWTSRDVEEHQRLTVNTVRPTYSVDSFPELLSIIDSSGEKESELSIAAKIADRTNR